MFADCSELGQSCTADMCVCGTSRTPPEFNPKQSEHQRVRRLHAQLQRRAVARSSRWLGRIACRCLGLPPAPYSRATTHRPANLTGCAVSMRSCRGEPLQKQSLARPDCLPLPWTAAPTRVPQRTDRPTLRLRRLHAQLQRRAAAEAVVGSTGLPATSPRLWPPLEFSTLAC